MQRRVAKCSPVLLAGRLMANTARSLNDVMHQMADCDAVVATRFHNVICALLMGKPTISVGYAAKFDVLMADMGLAAFCQNVEQLDVDLLQRQLRQLLEKREEVACAIRTRTREYQDQLRRQEAVLAKMLQRD